MDEKERMLVLGFLAFLFFGLASVVDGAFTVKTYGELYKNDWSGNFLWIYALTCLVSVASLLVAVTSILADNHALSTEDLLGALLLFVQPWLLWWGGLLDAISRTTQEYLWKDSSWVTQGFAWTWLDPQSTSGVPFLPYVLSRVFGSVNTTSYGVLLGSALSILFVVGLWAVYYECA